MGACQTRYRLFFEGSLDGISTRRSRWRNTCRQPCRVPIAGALRTGDRQLESLGTLAGGIAHDFNNLLGGILSQTELALAELSEGASPEAEMKNIHAVAVRGAEIVRQLMVYAGQETDILELVDVSRLIEETAELLKVVVSKHADLQLRLSKDVPAVRANPAALRQILVNLVTNLSEAMGDRDVVVRVTTARIKVRRGFTWIRGTGGRLSSARSIRYG